MLRGPSTIKLIRTLRAFVLPLNKVNSYVFSAVPFIPIISSYSFHMNDGYTLGIFMFTDNTKLPVEKERKFHRATSKTESSIYGVVGGTVSPQNSHPRGAWECDLLGNRVFVDAIKLR